jgi:hypothetical protein
LIGLAVVRAVAAKVARSDSPSLADFASLKDYLRVVMEKDWELFDNELDFVLTDYGFPFSKTDFMAFCKI